MKYKFKFRGYIRTYDAKTHTFSIIEHLNKSYPSIFLTNLNLNNWEIIQKATEKNSFLELTLTPRMLYFESNWEKEDVLKTNIYSHHEMLNYVNENISLIRLDTLY